jgi:hypothetical protein
VLIALAGSQPKRFQEECQRMVELRISAFAPKLRTRTGNPMETHQVTPGGVTKTNSAVGLAAFPLAAGG